MKHTVLGKAGLFSIDCVESVYDVIVDESLDVLRPHKVHVVEVDVVHQCQALQIANFLSSVNHHLYNNGNESHVEWKNLYHIQSIIAHKTQAANLNPQSFLMLKENLL